jgi:hypothetical protein
MSRRLFVKRVVRRLTPVESMLPERDTYYFDVKLGKAMTQETVLQRSVQYPPFRNDTEVALPTLCH